MLLKICKLLLLFIIPFYSFSQSKVDSLQQLISTETDAEKKVKLLNQVAVQFKNKQTDSVIFYATLSLEQAKKANYNQGKANAYTSIAWANYKRSNYKEALKMSHQAIFYFKKKANNQERLGNCYRLIAAVYITENKYKEALSYLLKTKDLYNSPQLKNKEIKSLVLNDIAYLYLTTDNYIMSMKHLNESLNNAKENGYMLHLADCYNILATINSRHKDYTEAIKNFSTAKNIYKKKDNLIGVAICSGNIGITQYKSGKYQKAIETLQESKKQAVNIQYNLGQLSSLIYLGKSHIALNNLSAANSYLKQATQKAKKHNIVTHEISIAEADLAVKNNKTNKAITILENTIRNHMHEFSPKEQISLFENLSNNYQTQHDFKKALVTKNKLLKIKDSIYSIHKEIQVKVLQAEFDYKKIKNDLKIKENELQISEEKTRSSRLTILLLIITVTVFTGIAIIIYFRKKGIQKTKNVILKKEQELQNIQQKQLDNEIRFKNKQITDFALHISEKNDLLTSIKSKLKLLVVSNKKELLKINELVHFLNNNLEQNKEKVAIYSLADNTKDAFYHKLSDLYQSLTNKEKRVAAFVRLDLSSKQIATQLNISISSIDNYRHNLRKKMNVPKEITLSNFIKRI